MVIPAAICILQLITVLVYFATRLKEGDYVELRDRHTDDYLGKVLERDRLPTTSWPYLVSFNLQHGQVSSGYYARRELRKLDVTKETDAARIAAWKLLHE